MPRYILMTYPDWFPKFVDNPPKDDVRKRFKEQLRGMARDAKKSPKRNPPVIELVAPGEFKPQMKRP